MKKLALLFLLFSFTAQAQLQLRRGKTTTLLLSASGGGTYTGAIPLTMNSTLETLDDKEYIISGDITGAFDLTVELFAGSTLTFSGSPTYTGSTAVTAGELIMTNTQEFRSYNLNISSGAILTFDASGAVNDNGYFVFGTNFSSNFRVTGDGQVNFKGIKRKSYDVFSGSIGPNRKSMVFSMAEGGQVNIGEGYWSLGIDDVEVFANYFGSLDVAYNGSLNIQGTAGQFDKVTGRGLIQLNIPGNSDMNIKIGVSNGSCDWGGMFNEGFLTSGPGRRINIEKVGRGTIAFSNTNSLIRTLTIAAGAFSMGNGGGRGTIGSEADLTIVGRIINNATLIFNNPGNFDVNISGTGNFINKGDSQTTLSAAYSKDLTVHKVIGYSGTTTVESGELLLKCREIKNSAIIVQNGAGLYAETDADNKEITSTGHLSLSANSTLRFKFPVTKLVVPDITAPAGFLVELSGSMAASFSGEIILIKCIGTLPTILPRIVANSTGYYGSTSGSRKCVTLKWERGRGLLAIIIPEATRPAITPSIDENLCTGATRQYTISPGDNTATNAWTSTNPKVVSISANGLATALFKGRSAVSYTYGGCVVSTVITVKGHVIRPEDTNAAFCAGNGIILKAYDSPAGGSYTKNNRAWTSDHPLIATVAVDNVEPGKPEGYVTLLTPGNATIKFEDKDNCKAEYTINVKTAPTTTVNAGEDKEICAGVGASIGTTAQTGTTYSWSPATGLSASNVPDPTAGPTVTTTYTLTARTANLPPSECPATDKIKVKVNPLPGITSAQGPSSQIRPDATLNLRASANGIAGSWASSDVGNVTIVAGTTDAKSATATGKAVGVATITYTDPKGCIGTHAVTVSTSTKTNQTIHFPEITAQTVGDADFTLPARNTTSNSTLPITYHTTYTDKVTINGNKAKFVKAGKVQIEARLAGNDTYNPATQLSNIFCINPAQPTIRTNNKTLTSSAENGNQWYLNNTPIAAGATGKTYIATTDGNYTVKVTIEECASAFSDPVRVVVTGDNSTNELLIFPNPVHDQLVIELPAHENGLISLFSVTGLNLHSTSAAGKAIISMKDFPAGIYILKIQTAGKIRVRKVVRN